MSKNKPHLKSALQRTACALFALVVCFSFVFSASALGDFSIVDKKITMIAYGKYGDTPQDITYTLPSTDSGDRYAGGQSITLICTTNTLDSILLAQLNFGPNVTWDFTVSNVTVTDDYGFLSLYGQFTVEGHTLSYWQSHSTGRPVMTADTCLCYRDHAGEWVSISPGTSLFGTIANRAGYFQSVFATDKSIGNTNTGIWADPVDFDDALDGEQTGLLYQGLSFPSSSPGSSVNNQTSVYVSIPRGGSEQGLATTNVLNYGGYVTFNTSRGIESLVLPSSLPSAVGSNYLVVVMRYNGNYVLGAVNFSSNAWQFDIGTVSYYDDYGNVFYSGQITPTSVISGEYLYIWSQSAGWITVPSSNIVSAFDFYTVVATTKTIVFQGAPAWDVTTYQAALATRTSGVATPWGTNDKTFYQYIGDRNYNIISPSDSGIDGYSLVFGFVDGLFAGTLEAYTILANGITVGGISLGNVIYSILAILLLVFIGYLVVSLLKGD